MKLKNLKLFLTVKLMLIVLFTNVLAQKNSHHPKKLTGFTATIPSWTSKTIHNDIGTFYGIQAAPDDPGTIFMAGSGDFIYHSTNAGQSFTPIATPSGQQFFDLSVKSSHEFYTAAGSGNLYLNKYNSSGGYFSSIKINRNYSIFSVAAVAGTNKLVAYGNGGSSSGNKLFLSNDQGNTWIEKSIGSVLIEQLKYDKVSNTIYAFGERSNQDGVFEFMSISAIGSFSHLTTINASVISTPTNYSALSVSRRGSKVVVCFNYADIKVSYNGGISFGNFINLAGYGNLNDVFVTSSFVFFGCAQGILRTDASLQNPVLEHNTNYSYSIHAIDVNEATQYALGTGTNQRVITRNIPFVVFNDATTTHTYESADRSIKYFKYSTNLPSSNINLIENNDDIFTATISKATRIVSVNFNEANTSGGNKEASIRLQSSSIAQVKTTKQFVQRAKDQVIVSKNSPSIMKLASTIFIDPVQVAPTLDLSLIDIKAIGRSFNNVKVVAYLLKTGITGLNTRNSQKLGEVNIGNLMNNGFYERISFDHNITINAGLETGSYELVFILTEGSITTYMKDEDGNKSPKSVNIFQKPTIESTSATNKVYEAEDINLSFTLDLDINDDPGNYSVEAVIRQISTPTIIARSQTNSTTILQLIQESTTNTSSKKRIKFKRVTQLSKANYEVYYRLKYHSVDFATSVNILTVKVVQPVVLGSLTATSGKVHQTKFGFQLSFTGLVSNIEKVETVFLAPDGQTYPKMMREKVVSSTQKDYTYTTTLSTIGIYKVYFQVTYKETYGILPKIQTFQQEAPQSILVDGSELTIDQGSKSGIFTRKSEVINLKAGEKRVFKTNLKNFTFAGIESIRQSSVGDVDIYLGHSFLPTNTNYAARATNDVNGHEVIRIDSRETDSGYGKEKFSNLTNTNEGTYYILVEAKSTISMQLKITKVVMQLPVQGRGWKVSQGYSYNGGSHEVGGSDEFAIDLAKTEENNCKYYLLAPLQMKITELVVNNVTYNYSAGNCPEDNRSLGNFVRGEFILGYEMVFGHNDSFASDLVINKSVSMGSPFSVQGKTGCVTGPHTHIQFQKIYYDGNKQGLVPHPMHDGFGAYIRFKPGSSTDNAGVITEGIPYKYEEPCHGNTPLFDQASFKAQTSNNITTAFAFIPEVSYSAKLKLILVPTQVSSEEGQRVHEDSLYREYTLEEKEMKLIEGTRYTHDYVIEYKDLNDSIASGKYKLMLMVSNELQVFIKVAESDEFSINFRTTGIEDKLIQKLNIVGNPVNIGGSFTLEGKISKPVKIELVNMLGITLTQISLQPFSGKQSITLPGHLQAGIHFLKFANGHSKKLLIR